MKDKTAKTWNIIKNYRWQSMFYKYWRYLVFMFMIPILIFLTAIYFSNSNTVDKDINHTLSQSFLKTGMSVDKIFSEIYANHTIFNTNNEVSLFLHQENLYGFNMSNVAQRVYDLIVNFISTADYLDSVYIYSRKNNYVISSRGSNYLDEFRSTKWHGEISNMNNVIFPDFNENNQSVITFIQPVGTGEEKNPPGMLIVNIDTDKLENLILGDKNQEEIYLINEDKIIYSSNRTYINRQADEAEALKHISGYSDEISITRNRDNIICSTKLKNNIKLVSVVSKSQFSDSVAYLKNVLFISLLFAIILSLILSFYSSMHFYNTIAGIIVRMEAPFEGNKTNGSGKSGELTYITNNLMSIMKNNAEIESELVSKISALKKTQSIALQTQINPHFLFNTLNLVSVIMMRITKGDNDASRVVSFLTDILHAALDTNNYILKVHEEIEHAKKYIEIEKIKTINSFDVIWGIAPEVPELKTIKLILQPIIENSIDHGFKLLRSRRGVLSINVKIEGDELLFIIKDNGHGIPAHKLKEINEILASDEIQETKNIGISNVNQRIKLIYGEAYGVKIASDENGTSVYINMPVKR